MNEEEDATLEYVKLVGESPKPSLMFFPFPGESYCFKVDPKIVLTVEKVLFGIDFFDTYKLAEAGLYMLFVTWKKNTIASWNSFGVIEQHMQKVDPVT